MYPPEMPLRPCTIGGTSVFEDGEALSLRATIIASRSLIWGATGWQYENAGRVVEAGEGLPLSFSLPPCDMVGFRTNDGTNTIIDVSAPNSYTHLYDIRLSILKDGAPYRNRVYKDVYIPTEDLSEVDIDKLLPVKTVAGGIVLVPDSWSGLVDQVVSAANEVIQESRSFAEDSAVSAGLSADSALLAGQHSQTANDWANAAGTHAGTATAQAGLAAAAAQSATTQAGLAAAAAQSATQDAVQAVNETFPPLVAQYVAENPPAPGDDGREVELRTTATHVQWRYVGDASWTDLVSLVAITGDDGLSVELQTTATHIQWRLVGGAWADLVALSALVGPAGPPNELSIGTVTTGAPGSAAAASVSGAAPSQVLNLTIPTGATGAVSAWEYYAAGRPDVVGTLDAAALAWRNAAPSGSTFYSTNGPQGAWVWRKRGASWVCVEGDTGWRKIIEGGVIQPGFPSTGVAPTWGRLRIRRTPGQIWLSFDDLQWAAGATPSFTFLQGLEGAWLVSADSRTYPGTVFNLYNPSVPIRFDGSELVGSFGSSAIRIRDLRAFPADNWPTTLPGTPA